MTFSCFRVFVACAAVAAVASSASAQMTGAPTAGYRREPGMTASTVPAPLREIGFDQHIGAFVPLDTAFRDEAGRTVRLGDYFGPRPVVMVFAYYDCPMLCTQVISGLTSALKTLSPEPGNDFEIFTVSFDPRDPPGTSPPNHSIFVEPYNRPPPPAACHFLTASQ